MNIKAYEILLYSGTFIFLLIGVLYFLGKVNKRKYTIIKNRKSVLTKLRNKYFRRGILEKILHKTAIKLGMFNNMDYEKNLNLGLMLLFILTILYTAGFIVIIPMLSLLWYVFLMWVILITVFIMLIIYVIFRFAVMSFTSKLPKAFKVINSRYMDSRRIDIAIEKSLLDIDGAVRKELIKIYDALKQNNREKIDTTFSVIERTYNNEYLTFLLVLIKQAHFKGGSDTVINQFEEATEEIMLDIENKKDLSAAGRMYIIMSILFPFFSEAAKSFNKTSLGTEAVNAYYSSPEGMRVYFAILILAILLTGFLIYMERK
jgi:Flp pilus assembly protein TadB